MVPARVLVGLLSAGFSAAGLAQSLPAAGLPAGTGAETRPTDEAGWLAVTGDHVLLRSRGDRNSVAVAEVGRDAVLESRGAQYGWHRVVPPTGVFCFAAAEFVDQLTAERGVVSVRSGRLRVRVGSLLTDLDPAHSEVQMLLERGTEVRIVGKQGDWLKIAPPDGVYLYVAREFVEPITAEEAARRRAAGRAGSDLAAGRRLGAPSQPTSAPDLSGPWGQRLLLIETAIEAESRKPALEQTWDALKDRLRPVAEQREEPAVARLAQQWVLQLSRREADQAAWRAAQAVVEREARDRAQFAREAGQIQRAREGAGSRPAFAARGQFLESVALRGAEAAPRYKLQDPLTGQVVAYVELPADSTWKPADFLGRYVGVRGDSRRDATLGADIVRATQIEVLKEEVPASAPARQNP